MEAGSNLSWQGTKRKAVYTKGAGPICKCMGQCTLEGSVQGGGYTLGMQNFFNVLLKLTSQRRPKVTCLVHH